MNDIDPATGKPFRGRPAGSRSEDVKVERRRRPDSGAMAGQKLYVPDTAKDQNFSYRWANDTPGRIEQLTKADDWDVVSDITDHGQNEGTTEKRVVDKETGRKAVLLRKRKEYYEADKAEGQKLLDARDEAMRRGAPNDSQGLSGSEAYVPNGKNVISRG